MPERHYAANTAPPAQRPSASPSSGKSAKYCEIPEFTSRPMLCRPERITAYAHTLYPHTSRGPLWPAALTTSLCPGCHSAVTLLCNATYSPATSTLHTALPVAPCDCLTLLLGLSEVCCVLCNATYSPAFVTHSATLTALSQHAPYLTWPQKQSETVTECDTVTT